LNYRSDQILINHFLGKKELGIYSIAVSLSELAFSIPQSVSGALMGRLVNQNQSQNETIIKTIKYSFYITLIAVGIGVLLSPVIIFIYGSNYVDAISILRILFIGIVFATIGKVIAPIAVADGKPAIHLYISLASLIINVVFNYLLIPKYGIKGSAIASAISYLIYGTLYALFLLTSKKISFQDIFILNKSDLISIVSVYKKILKIKLQ
ncbi:polysaccharide biosynthesis C-terminal domain-containing protein, partial [Neobacillus drentensis]|uniref:MATE family efflux transporter n=1 Tax=Neobacillus drentensis TaxID=220684 RepID=UPI002FFDBFEF